MVRTAEGLGINTVAQLTTMDQPIGTHIGNALEVLEAFMSCRAEGPWTPGNSLFFRGQPFYA